ncbi:hypothetical protein AB0K43_26765 [Kitasatospora sp. NPDC049258]|uniref:hypothetical protein n=1 Tax=Kitasatospora sp. NPDC049258 TaxID=3155394 RepID=UPI003438C886
MTAADRQGRAPSPETVRWQQAAAALGPEQTLLRIAANAKYLVATVTLVGTALTALGLVSVDRLADRPLPRTLAGIAVLLTLLAVLLALGSLVLRSRDVRLGNLEDVKAWYQDEFKRAGRVTAAGWLLLGGILFAGAAGIVAAVAAAPSYQVGLQSAARATGTALSVKATADDVADGSVITVKVTGTDRTGAETLLITGSGTADHGGDASIEASAVVSTHFDSYAVVLTADDHQRAALTVPGT